MPTTISIPSWQPDSEVQACPLCKLPFNFFFLRRHHCRKCGRVVCGSCSSTWTEYLPSTYVVTKESCHPGFNSRLQRQRQLIQAKSNPHQKHRTCDECVAELDRIRHALGNVGQSNRKYRSGAPIDTKLDSAIVETLAIGSDSEEDSDNGFNDNNNKEINRVLTRCPICHNRTNKDEGHFEACIREFEFGSPSPPSSQSPQSALQPHRRNRMILYKLPQDLPDTQKCLVCFESFRRGEAVGRLECLCLYHERCILDWFARKGVGECPLHMASS